MYDECKDTLFYWKSIKNGFFRSSRGKVKSLFLPLYRKNTQGFHNLDRRRDSLISCYLVLYAVTYFMLQLFCNDKGTTIS